MAADFKAMRVVLSIVAVLTLWTAVFAAHGETALEAIKKLPKDQAARIARIEARDGTPGPDRWYILTQDPKADNGVHEFVVSNGEIVASRSVSQFAESLTPQDMLGDGPLTVDSDKLSKLAQDYAQANGAVVTSMNYELKKDGTDAAPTWTVSCIDEKGTKVGTLVVTAGKGNVVSHDGFTLEPAPEAAAGATPHEKDGLRFDTYAKPDVAPGLAAASPSPADSADDTDGPGPHHHHVHPEKKPASPIAKALNSVGHTLQKLNPF